MKVNDKRLLYWGIIVCLLISGGIAYALYPNKTKYWKEQSSATFKKALELELQKRDTASVFYKESTGYSTISLSDSLPESVKIISEFGEREYFMPKKKRDHALVKEKLKRSTLSIILEDNPLAPDTLNAIWDSLLIAVDIPVKTRTRISVLDLHEHESVSYSKDIFESFPADSLLSYYLGERCEVEVTGFISYGWHDAFVGWGYFVICLPWIIFVLLFFLREKIILILKRWFIRYETVIIETIVPVVAVETGKSYVYQLEEGVFFDTEKKELNRDGATRKLEPQAASLLKLFLDSEGCRLSTAEIDKYLWPDGSGTQERIHTAIRRLRRSLNGITHLVVNYENGVYQLINSITNESVKNSTL
ncbi:winged helix-turn-helix domain-containing protein [Bacteroides sp. UBA939]|uniref:winged helix-turn-helix domain-containing protein n=1 Tax=Bacteroides sp. UBA939 TaxID=1946092 RepID=UPI0025BB8E71|nr:hypothetical protein [Bacteroides sp. UBA939]